MFSNFHTHSTYCDGKSTPEEIVDYAVQLNLKSLGFSSHAPIPFECPWCMKRETLNDYLMHINSLKNSKQGIAIYTGLEVDYIPDTIGPLDFSKTLDYTIGSIHFVENFRNGKGWEIDGSHQHFHDGLAEIFKNNIKDAVDRYFELTREMALKSRPTIIGHLDKIKLQNTGYQYFNEADRWYRETIEDTLKAIQTAGCIIEVNTRGVYQKKTDSVYPSRWILESIKKKRIPITVSSDAHHSNDLISYFAETFQLLREIGFKEIHILTESQWKPYKFNEDGIKIN